MLTTQDLYSLEEYARIRAAFRNKVMKHKTLRRQPVGAHATLYFEDRLTMQYQVQEMLRLECIFEPKKIQEELDVYTPLIPDGSNWKATFMLEYQDAAERRAMLSRLIGIEKAVWVQVDGFERVHPYANEDLDRQTADRTAAVHFLRFELTPDMVAAVKQGAGIKAGVEHPAYKAEVKLPQPVRDSLAADLN